MLEQLVTPYKRQARADKSGATPDGKHIRHTQCPDMESIRRGVRREVQPESDATAPLQALASRAGSPRLCRRANFQMAGTGGLIWSDMA